ncbi:Zinc finger and BTB domain-containing protein 5-like [Scleropages formosus]|uniref:Zinc finger and BTB domain-containing protein 5-like n=1 Tax=Scleropages formosus TaxID=113540 RepID=A0A0P7T6J2_SCLFO|nr:Zinc finger and BTB domain-containing protein 5-like [Scleropages formosus]
MCDCVIVVGNRHFKAHRAVLAACSTHFRALFSVAESNGGMNVIQLDSEVVTAEALSVLVDMMYTSTLMLEESNVMDVLLAASHLHLNSVVKACKHYMSTRTLHLSLPGKRYMHCSDQHAAGTASSSRLQHPFLQQYKVLPIKVKEEAEQEEQQQPQQMQVVVKSEPPSLPEAPYETSNITCQAEGSDQTEPVADKVEQRASLPIRRFHKRKQSLPLVSPEDQPKRRPRLSSAASEEPSWVRVVVEAVGEEGEFFSPDSHRVADESKHETDMAVEDDDGGRSGMPGELYRSQAAREDAQVPGESDSIVAHEQGLQEKEEYSDILQKCEVLIKVKEEVEEQQPQQMHVVVKSEAPDETNNVTSWAEGSDQAEPVAVKAEISPQSSVRSFSDTHSDTDCIPETHCSSGGGLVVLAWVSGATAELLPKCHWMGVPGSICAERHHFVIIFLLRDHLRRTPQHSLLRRGWGTLNAPAAASPHLTRASEDVLSEHNVLVVEGPHKICCKTFLALTDCKKHVCVHRRKALLLPRIRQMLQQLQLPVQAEH